MVIPDYEYFTCKGFEDYVRLGKGWAKVDKGTYPNDVPVGMDNPEQPDLWSSIRLEAARQPIREIHGTTNATVVATTKKVPQGPA
jgi:hypothetical protein